MANNKGAKNIDRYPMPAIGDHTRATNTTDGVTLVVVGICIDIFATYPDVPNTGNTYGFIVVRPDDGGEDQTLARASWDFAPVVD